jgi:hypothetical protein
MKAVDLDTMTPLDALLLLSRLRQKMGMS